MKLKCTQCNNPLYDFYKDIGKCKECFIESLKIYFSKITPFDFSSLEKYFGIEKEKVSNKEEAIKKFLKLIDQSTSFKERIVEVLEAEDWWYFGLFGVGAGGYFMEKETNELEHKGSGVPAHYGMFRYNEKIKFKKNRT
jgi:hypothetical protein